MFAERDSGEQFVSIQSANQQRQRYFECLEHRNLLASDVVINEIHYDPPDKTQLAEYIELYNNSPKSIDLSGWAFTDGVDYQIPDGTTLQPNTYLVVAQDPTTTNSLFDVMAIGPWNGSLRNSGERIELSDDLGRVVDEVDYQRGFPWPTIGDQPGYSIELIHPDLENSLGGNWRRATAETNNPISFIERGSTWKYLPGLERQNSDWTQNDFDDSAWETGESPIGYGDGHVKTRLAMRGNYSTVYLRQQFNVSDPDEVKSLVFQAQFDDGFNLWINGEHLAQANVTTARTAYNASATEAIENLDFVDYVLPDPRQYLLDGVNTIAIHLVNASLNGSSDAWLDAELRAGNAKGTQSPGASNTVFSDNAAPAIRKVDHGKAGIGSNEAVTITAKVTDPDGVENVTLEYQVVRPGDYFARYLKANSSGDPVLNPRYDDPNEWSTLFMQDGGLAGDDIFTVVIPASVQQHRNLIRYRISVRDTLGATARVPYADDLQHNFAYFVYDEVPDWTGSIRPGRDPALKYELSEFRSIATYHLLTTPEDHADSQHIPGATAGGYTGSEYLWPGTMVYDGEVYDNIRYRARGGTWRYAMGKNMWKFDFNRGRSFQAKDDYGTEYNESWDKLNFSALIQQGNYLHRGEQGLFESVGFKLFNLAGVESPNTHYVHFRVIDSENENGEDQFSGDFQGLYLAIEQPDGHMLEEHGLPDGNLYKIERHQGDANNQGPTQVSDGSDVAAFISGYRERNATPEWWEANLDLDRYYSYRTIVEGIHHYDIAYGKNYYYYHNPETDKFQVHPWDLDLTWANNMYGSGEHDFVLDVARNDAFEIDYQNRVRELRDLLYNPEQTGLLIDEFASMVDQPNALSWVDVDRAMWDYNPIMRSSMVNPSKSGQGRFYEQSAADDFAGMAQLMKDYVADRSRWLDARNRTNRRAPETPELTYTGAPEFPVNDLAFQTSPFADPNGSDFAAIEWRIAEITDPIDPQLGTSPPMYEITATWESGELAEFGSTLVVPADEVSEGSLYRVRVRMKNTDGIWSHWSAPQQFVTTNALASDVASSLRISEIHYNPADPNDAEVAAGFTDADEFEFIELVNIGTQTISLANTSFQRIELDGAEEGVEFNFDDDQELGPEEHILVVEDIEAFQLRYGDELLVVGEWSGKLGNGGEFLTLVDDGTTIHAFAYDDIWYKETDGDGFSLESVNTSSNDINDWARKAGWQPSQILGGTPGTGRASLSILGDFDGDSLVDENDIDLLHVRIANGDASGQYDLNGDNIVSGKDADHLIENILNTSRGDFNLDGEVSFLDFLLLAQSFGSQNTGWATGDSDGDGRVSFLDFLAMAENFGKKRT